MAEKIEITKTTCGVIAFGKSFKLTKGENMIDVDAWGRFKKFPHVVARIESGELIEGERHGKPPEPSPEPSDSDAGSDEGAGDHNTDEGEDKPKSKSKRNRR